MTETTLEQAVSAAAADPDNLELLDAVGAAWVRAKAAELAEVVRLRQRQAALVAEARQHVDALRRSEREAHQRLREAVEEHEAALLAQRIFLNRGAVVRAGATAETDQRRGELAGTVARTQATRQRLADEYHKATTLLQRAAAEVERIEGDGALR